MRDFEGRTGVVTGAAGGMGAAAVRLFAERGVVGAERGFRRVVGLQDAGLVEHGILPVAPGGPPAAAGRPRAPPVVVGLSG